MHKCSSKCIFEYTDLCTLCQWHCSNLRGQKSFHNNPTMHTTFSSLNVFSLKNVKTLTTCFSLMFSCFFDLIVMFCAWSMKQSINTSKKILCKNTNISWKTTNMYILCRYLVHWQWWVLAFSHALEWALKQTQEMLSKKSHTSTHLFCWFLSLCQQALSPSGAKQVRQSFW